jgi:virulence-associated protein VagC
MKSEVATRPARVFRNGNSVAVRLPKGWAKPGMLMQASRNGRSITLKSKIEKPKTLGEVLKEIWAAGPDPGPFVRQQPPLQVREFMKDE